MGAPAASVVLDFCDSVIAELPRLEFELTADVLQTWIDARLAVGAKVAREATGPGTSSLSNLGEITE